MQEVWVQSLSQEESLEKEMATFLARKSNGHRSLVGYSPRGHKRVRYDLVTKQQQQLFFNPLNLDVVHVTT